MFPVFPVTKEQPSKAGSAETEREKNLMIPVDTPLTSKSSKPTMNIHSSSGQMFTRSPLISSLAGPSRMLNTSQLQGEEMQRILETYLENIGMLTPTAATPPPPITNMQFIIFYLL